MTSFVGRGKTGGEERREGRKGVGVRGRWGGGGGGGLRKGKMGGGGGGGLIKEREG